MDKFSEFIAVGSASTAQALALFDSLDIVETDAMLGAWQGAGFPTGHPLDGLLEVCHWYGKAFLDPEHVHPLVFTNLRGKKVSVNPALMPLGLVDAVPIPKGALVGRLFQRCLPLLSTRRSRARLRMTRYRGKVSATMIYDGKPINDIFRRVDEKTVLGVMDRKGMAQPFFFVLRREQPWRPTLDTSAL